MLPRVEEPTRDAPAAAGGLDGAAAEGQSTIADDQGSGAWLGIAEMHGPARRAHL